MLGLADVVLVLLRSTIRLTAHILVAIATHTAKLTGVHHSLCLSLAVKHHKLLTILMVRHVELLADLHKTL